MIKWKSGPLDTYQVSSHCDITISMFAPRQMISRSDRVAERHANEIGTLIVDRTVPLHYYLRPGLRETMCAVTWAAKLRKRGWSVERQVPRSIESKEPRFDERFRADLIIERRGECGTRVR